MSLALVCNRIPYYIPILPSAGVRALSRDWNFGYRDLDQNLRLEELNGESLTRVEDPDPN
jgi:hypothetical protein